MTKVCLDWSSSWVNPKLLNRNAISSQKVLELCNARSRDKVRQVSLQHPFTLPCTLWPHGSFWPLSEIGCCATWTFDLILHVLYVLMLRSFLILTQNIFQPVHQRQRVMIILEHGHHFSHDDLENNGIMSQVKKKVGVFLISNWKRPIQYYFILNSLNINSDQTPLCYRVTELFSSATPHTILPSLPDGRTDSFPFHCQVDLL